MKLIVVIATFLTIISAAQGFIPIFAAIGAAFGAGIALAPAAVGFGAAGVGVGILAADGQAEELELGPWLLLRPVGPLREWLLTLLLINN